MQQIFEDWILDLSYYHYHLSHNKRSIMSMPCSKLKYWEIPIYRPLLKPATDRTWVITECRNKEEFFLTITEVLSEVGTNFWTLKSLGVFLSLFATELSYLVDIFSLCSKDDCVGSLFRTYLHRSILWDQYLYFLIKYFNFLF